MDVIVQNVDVLIDEEADWQDVENKNDCESNGQDTQSWRKKAEIFVHNWCVAEETASCLFWKETDLVTADEDGNISQNYWEDAACGAEREEGFLLPILVVLEVELIEIPEQADDCQCHAHDS